MIRMTLLLLAGMFATMQIGGKDNGQMRFGLMEAEQEAALIAAEAAQLQDTTVARNDTGSADRPADADAVVLDAAYVPAKPLIVAAKPVVEASANVEAVAEAPIQIKYVAGRSVNVRGGPSTADSVVGKLTRGEAVSVIAVEDNGWAKIRVEGDGIDGFMSLDFLTDTAP